MTLEERRERNKSFVPHFLGDREPVTIKLEREFLRSLEYLVNGFPDEPWVVTLAVPILRRARESERVI